MSAKIIYGNDYRGVELKQILLTHAKAGKRCYQDIGINTGSLLDYVDVSREIAEELNLQSNAIGIGIGRQGCGLAMVLNRFSHIRACVCTTVGDAVFARQKLNANVVCLSADTIAPEVACEIVEAFISTPFLEGKHLHCVEKISKQKHEDNDSSIAFIQAMICFEDKILLHFRENDSLNFLEKLYYFPHIRASSKISYLDRFKDLVEDELKLSMQTFKFLGTFEQKLIENLNTAYILNQIFYAQVQEINSKTTRFSVAKNIRSVWYPINALKNCKFYSENLKNVALEFFEKKESSMNFKSDVNTFE